MYQARHIVAPIRPDHILTGMSYLRLDAIVLPVGFVEYVVNGEHILVLQDVLVEVVGVLIDLEVHSNWRVVADIDDVGIRRLIGTVGRGAAIPKHIAQKQDVGSVENIPIPGQRELSIMDESPATEIAGPCWVLVSGHE